MAAAQSDYGHFSPAAPQTRTSKPEQHVVCNNGRCMMGGHAVQVLFDNQGRSTKNKSVDLEDIKFHQCVRLTRFENDRTISFIPPDGNFDLM